MSPPSKQSDEFLITQVQQGVKHQFEPLIDRYSRLVMSVLLSKGVNYQQAEDLTQEVFFRAFTKLGTYKNHHSFSRWLLTIAHNLFIDSVRKKQIKPCSIEGVAKFPKVASPEDIAIGKAQAESLTSALTLDQKVLLELRVTYRLPFKDVAEILDCPEGTLRVRFYRILSELRRKVTRKEEQL